MSIDAIIRANGLHMAYPGAATAALNELSLTIAAGECLGLLGQNGAGKTTFISILCGILSPTSGTVEIRRANESWVTARAGRSLLGLVPQELAFYPTLSVLENLQFFGSMHGLAGHALRDAVEAGMAAARLTEVRDQRAGVLSGGLKRRLNLAIGLVHGPRVLVLDEPTAGMDPLSRQVLHEELRRLNQLGTTIVYTSHHLDEVEQLCSSIAVLDRGRLIAHGALDRLTREGVVTLRFAGPAPSTLAARIAALDPSCTIHPRTDTLMIRSTEPARLLRESLALAAAESIYVVEASCGRRDLESLFLEWTASP